MSQQFWRELRVVGQVAGPTLSTGATTPSSCIPTHAKITLENNFFYIGRKLRLKLSGVISCVVTTPGTARFDLRLGGTVVWDSGALNLNVVAKTNVPFDLEVDLTCRAIGPGTATLLIGLGKFTSEAVVGAAVNTAGGNGTLLCPVGNTVVGTGIDSTAAQSVDVFFTQTVTTGSLTINQFEVEYPN